MKRRTAAGPARGRPGSGRGASLRAFPGFHSGLKSIGQDEGPRQQAGRKSLAANWPLLVLALRPRIASSPGDGATRATIQRAAGAPAQPARRRRGGSSGRGRSGGGARSGEGG